MSYMFDPPNVCLPSLPVPRLDRSARPGQLRVGMTLLVTCCWMLLVARKDLQL